MVEQQPSKLLAGVRIPSSAPNKLILPPKVRLLYYNESDLGVFYMKITRKVKIDIARKFLYEGITLKELSLEYDYNISNVKYVIALYRTHGEDIFLGDEESREHTRETKLDLISKVLKDGRSIRSVAIEYGLMDPTILSGWIKIYKNKGEDAIQTTRKRAPYKLEEEKLKEIADKELKERIKYLEAENEYLKKLHSLVLSRASQKKK